MSSFTLLILISVFPPRPPPPPYHFLCNFSVCVLVSLLCICHLRVIMAFSLYYLHSTGAFFCTLLSTRGLELHPPVVCSLSPLWLSAADHERDCNRRRSRCYITRAFNFPLRLPSTLVPYDPRTPTAYYYYQNNIFSSGTVRDKHFCSILPLLVTLLKAQTVLFS